MRATSCSNVGAPAVLLRVQLAVALHDPAEVAGARGAQDDHAPAAARGPGAAARRRARRRAGAARRRRGARARAPSCSAERRSSSAKAARPSAVSCATWRRPSVAERSRATSPPPLQPGEQPAEVAGVDPHAAAQVDDVEPLVLAQLEQHARLAERVRRVEVARLEQPELPGEEAAEVPDGGHGVGRHACHCQRNLCRCQRYRPAGSGGGRVRIRRRRARRDQAAAWRSTATTSAVGRKGSATTRSGLHAERGDRVGSDECEQHGALGRP